MIHWVLYLSMVVNLDCQLHAIYLGDTCEGISRKIYPRWETHPECGCHHPTDRGPGLTIKEKES